MILWEDTILDLLTLVYLSRSTEQPSVANGCVEQIVATARARNPSLGLTGALLFTGEHFAQVLEGPTASIDRLMARIAKDPRHDQLMVVARQPIAERRFGQWSMAYSGPSQFVARHVTRLLTNPAPPEQGRSVNWLNDLMWEFAEGPGAF